jgi:putative alpha-1,2-mannosidase
MAKEIGQESIYREYIRRAQFYKNIFDPSTGFMRPKLNGGWHLGAGGDAYIFIDEIIVR